jgi:ribosome biogenesis GTPase / thiamine phosphate phosphatase
MKQRDKKVHIVKPERITGVRLPDPDVLDDAREQTVYKTRRSAHKQHESFKENLTLVQGRIAEVKSNYLYIVEVGGKYHTASLCGRLKQFSFESRALSTVGDVVDLDTSAAPDYRIENIHPRKSTLSRYAGGGFQKEIIIASNIDQVVITSSWRMPMFKPGLIDRYLCIAAIEGLSAIIVINKVDLCEDSSELEEAVEYYHKSGFKIICVSALTGEGMQELKQALKDKDSVFSGQSGTGKSTLINWLEPELNLPTAEVSGYNEKGKHTTSQSILIPWSFGGHLLDTPGIKTVNLHRDAKPEIARIFPGFAKYAAKCRFRDCSHDHEADCAVLKALEKGKIPPERYESYLRIRESL